MGIGVFVLDDHVMVRGGMCMLLEAQPGMDVVGQAESGEDALPMLRRLRPDVLLCDVHLPGISGLEVTERVVRGGYGTRVIVVSASQEAPLPRRAPLTRCPSRSCAQTRCTSRHSSKNMRGRARISYCGSAGRWIGWRQTLTR